VIDVLGWDLEDARRVLETDGRRVEVTETRSPRPVRVSGGRRVVRQREGPDGVIHLVVTRERYEPARAPGA
jgi:hypothetical protein